MPCPPSAGVVRISQERFGQELTNFIRTSTRTNSTAKPAITSLLLPVGIYRSSKKKTAENAASDGFGSHFRGSVFCLAQPIGGLFATIRYRTESQNVWPKFIKFYINVSNDLFYSHMGYDATCQFRSAAIKRSLIECT